MSLLYTGSPPPHPGFVELPSELHGLYIMRRGDMFAYLDASPPKWTVVAGLSGTEVKYLSRQRIPSCYYVNIGDRNTLHVLSALCMSENIPMPIPGREYRGTRLPLNKFHSQPLPLP